MADGRRHVPLSATARARRALAQYTAPSTPSASKAGSSRQTPVDLTNEQTPARGGKRKAGAEYPPGAKSKKPAATSKEDPSSSSSAAAARKGRGGDGRAAAAPAEKRLRRFRAQPPQSLDDIYDRATTQRFFVLSRTRTGTDECPGEVVELTGSTGNVYTVTIGLVPECDCPHAKKGNQCKHIIFVMAMVLKAPFHHTYQLALLSSELRDIFAAAPPIEDPSKGDGKDAGSEKRKPIEGDCPICYSELGDGKSEAIVWCRAACGQNIHQECFMTWARTKGGGDKVTCPMCRSVWEGDPGMVGKIEKSRGTVSEGYVNVADQLGISQVRDMSTYSPWFGLRRRYDGY